MNNVGDTKVINGVDSLCVAVGAGSAGAVVASRLSEDPSVKVLLLEAGGAQSALHDVPLLAAEFQKTRVDWQYKTVPQDVACFGLDNRVKFTDEFSPLKSFVSYAGNTLYRPALSGRGKVSGFHMIVTL